MIRKLLLIVSFLFSNVNATVGDYSYMGKQTLSAFYCANLAVLSKDSLSDNMKEADRLFLYGYESGKEFIEAIMSKKIKPEEYRKNTPVIFLWIMRDGQSTDFMLGRLFEWSLTEAGEKASNSYKDKGFGASEIFYKKNCSLIGR